MLTSKEKSDTKRLPMMPIRDVVIFPYMMTPFVVGRESSVRALEEALAADKKIFLATQHDASVDEPRPDEIYSVGTVANIVQSLKLPDGNIKVLVEGVERGKIVSVSEDEGYFRALVKTFNFKVDAGAQLEALVSRVTGLFEQYVKLSQNLNYETMIAAIRVDEPGKLADTVGANLQLTIEEKQELLEIFDPVDRLTRVAEMLDIEIEKLNVDRTIQGRVKRQMEKAQKEYYLNEKIKAIQKELGRGEKSEFDELKKKIDTAGMTKDAHEKANAELKRLENMPPMSAESTVSRNYLDWLLAVPWKKKSKEIRDLKFAQQVLESDHYGLEKIKERILEFLAVRRLVKNPKGSILCFVGPPGVGKTSLGMSIAKATGRKFVRLSLGGVRDEAEVRGHRRTYIGALARPDHSDDEEGRHAESGLHAGRSGQDVHGFPRRPVGGAARSAGPRTELHVRGSLPGRRVRFEPGLLHRHRQRAPHRPPALQDRMEVIRLSGYTELEKLEIAKRFLVPKQMRKPVSQRRNLEFTDDGMQSLIQSYTREAGVRNLEREIGNVCRKIARKVVNARGEAAKKAGNETSHPSVDAHHETVVDFSVPIKFRDLQADKKNEVGATVGLAWTEVGGTILTTEAAVMEGKGKLQTTGKLGDVMQESAHAAMSYVRSRAHLLGLPRDFYRNLDIHVHVPEGAIPKDGPSAGITIATSICSALTNIPVRCNLAMTGEITVRGRVLPIGGLKEKVLAAHRQGIFELVLPKDNEKDLPDIPENIRKEMNLHFVTSMDEVLKIALEREIIALPLAAPRPPPELVRQSTGEERKFRIRA